MALTAKLLHLRPKARPITNPSFTRFFSDEANRSPDTSTDATSTPSQSKSSLSCYFSDVKASLKQQPSPSPSPPRRPFNFSSSSSTTSTTGSGSNQSPPSKIASLEEIRKNLSEFRRAAGSVQPPTFSGDGRRPSPSPSQTVSFQELYKRNVIAKGESNADQSAAGKITFDKIRETLRQLKSSTDKNQAGESGRANDSMSISLFGDRFKQKTGDPNAKTPTVIGGSDTLPLSVFGKELSNKEVGRDKDAMRTDFLKTYSYKDLGDKLKMLRPETKDKKKGWFTLAELNERLIKLREDEKKQGDIKLGGISTKELRESLLKLQSLNEDKKKTTTMQRLDVLGQIGGTPSFMLSPPKDHLVKNYFHPDNMSSAEKMTVELQKVRDEFKMSESDCGSARVQVAQLTTKIKHLSSVLHKKDKHSRKGLIAMVQRRKKLLKYLRRTDWDSYCLVLSKLGLRDNPDYKN